MSITFTKKTTLVYGNGWVSNDQPGSLARWIFPYSELMREAGKTDGTWDLINDTTTVRLWVDEESAQGFVKMIEDAVQETGRTDISITVSDI
jgi:hypothetical protein